MSKTPRQPFTLEEAVRICAYIGPDGHSILSLDFVDEMGGVPLVKIEPFAKQHVNQLDDHKETIYDPETGEPKAALMGVYTLDLLRGIKNDLALATGDYFGRGRQAQAIVNAVEEAARAAGIPWPEFNDSGDSAESLAP